MGRLLAQGLALPRILADLGHVAEGVPTAPMVLQRARALGVEMPIVQAVCEVLDGQPGADPPPAAGAAGLFDPRNAFRL